MDPVIYCLPVELLSAEQVYYTIQQVDYLLQWATVVEQVCDRAQEVP